MATIEEIEKRRSARRAAHDAGRAAQEAIDLEAIDAIEESQGEPLHTVTLNTFRAGVPVRIAFRTPAPLEYRRYSDLVTRAAQNKDQGARRQTQEQFATACLVYPAADSDARKAVLDVAPGLLLSIAIEAAKVAEARSDEEGKG